MAPSTSIPKVHSRLIDLLCGWPSHSLLPIPALKTASTTALSTPEIFQPGLEYGPDEGYQPLRQQIAQWLTGFYEPSQPILEDRIGITGGASQNIGCILQVFTDPVYTRNIWLVSPTYHLVSRIFDDSGFAEKLRAAVEDEEGVDIGYLEEEMRKSEERAVGEGNIEPKVKPPRPWRKIYKHVIYATPTFSNPSTKVMTTKRREQLVRLARKYDALIVADDVYDQLQWPRSEASEQEFPNKAYMPRIVDIDRFLDGGPKDEFGNAISNGSFSKIIGPGCRTGWTESTPKFSYGLSQTGTSRSGGSPSHLVATFITQMLANSTLQTHINTVLQPSYSSRYHRTMSSIKTHLLPHGITLPSAQQSTSTADIAGGYFIWLELPDPLRASELGRRCREEEDLVIAKGGIFEVRDNASDDGGNCFEKFVRVCFAWEDEVLLEEGIERLGRVVGRMVDEKDRGNVCS